MSQGLFLDQNAQPGQKDICRCDSLQFKITGGIQPNHKQRILYKNKTGGQENININHSVD